MTVIEYHRLSEGDVRAMGDRMRMTDSAGREAT